jgi:PPM family protein phosphatase
MPCKVSLAVGERLLLCTDGLTSGLDDDQTTELLSRHMDPEPACLALIDAANAAGGPDNITVVLLRADPPASGPHQPS